jgi:hypothetical protein
VRRRRALVLLALGAAAVAADQAVLRTALADGVLFGRFVAPFDPPVFTAAQRAHVARLANGSEVEPARFDAELGWCTIPSSTWEEATFDERGFRAGARPHAALPAAGAERVLALGCSYTMAMEVGDAEAWPARVEAAEPDLEVVNLGVAGFGIDQAYLRYRRDGRALGAREVWLGVMPEAALRVSTLYVPLCQRWAPVCAFKPRFVPDDGAAHGLRLVPSPARTHGGVAGLLTDQAAFVAALAEDDLWVRRTPAAFAPRGSSLSHRFAATRLALTAYERRGLRASVWLRDPESEVYRVMRRAVLALRDAAGEDGARLRVAVLPSRPDLEAEAYWVGLVRDLEAAGVDCLDASGALRAAGGAEEPGLWMPKGHYSPRANAIVAETLRTAWRGAFPDSKTPAILPR